MYNEYTTWNRIEQAYSKTKLDNIILPKVEVEEDCLPNTNLEETILPRVEKGLCLKVEGDPVHEAWRKISNN